ncbi:MULTISPECIES: hypothetical protein [Methylobacterium]|uniref:Uncharacterized protein n=1 Tax=Methylobacterium longum TaxID=767694 RepID=A0ABT8ASZ5_9HYPH|nr:MULTISPECIES: hypothetical protein [Methylobacterium]MCJ2098784.1 hypothetical protein [Methylobacterium sp. E-046]MDN3572413.1 hypothetical protein [Methylobacterium longum]GJE09445.1 hypothetical protein FOHLNKBM_0469 [Methylobacterium longum]
MTGSRRARTGPSRIGWQCSSTLIAPLLRDGCRERDLTPLGTGQSRPGFTRGVPVKEARNTGPIALSADRADTDPIHAQASGAGITHIAREAPSPGA